MPTSPSPRKRLACAVVACGLLTLSACGSNNADESQATSSARPTTTTKATTTSTTTTRAADDLDREAAELAEDIEDHRAEQPSQRGDTNPAEGGHTDKRTVQVPGRAQSAPAQNNAAPAPQSPATPEAESTPQDDAAPQEETWPEPPVYDPNPIDAQGVPVGETYYANCGQAPGPLLPHQAGYRDALDSDKDGIACEPDESDIVEAATAPAGGYESCKAAREAGATPLREGTPGYNPKLDKDGDGVACEK